MSAAVLPLLSGASALVKTGVRWWLDELRALVPAPAKRLFRGRPRWLIVDVSDAELIIGELRSRYRHLARSVLLSEEISSPQLAKALPRAVRRTAVAVRLPPHEVMRRRLDLPLAAERRLRDVLSHELEQRTPFLTDQVCFDYRIVARRPDVDRLDVELALVPRPVADRAIRLVQRAGFGPQALGVWDGEAAPPLFNFLERERAKKPRWQRRLALALCVLAAMLGIAAIQLAFDRQDALLIDLRAQLAEAKRGAQTVETLRGEIERATQHGRFLLDRQRAPRFVETLAALTHLLPDDTWVFDLHISLREGSISGFSPSAASLIGLFEASDAFGNAHFRSPVTQGPKPGSERFDLSFETKEVAR